MLISGGDMMTMKPVSTNKHCLPFYDRPNGCRK